MRNIFKTVPLSEKREYKNLSMNHQILKLFRTDSAPRTAWQVLRELGYERHRIVSVRRSMTCLCYAEKLEKTDRIVKEQEGEWNHKYELL